MKSSLYYSNYLIVAFSPILISTILTRIVTGNHAATKLLSEPILLCQMIHILILLSIGGWILFKFGQLKLGVALSMALPHFLFGLFYLHGQMPQFKAEVISFDTSLWLFTKIHLLLSILTSVYSLRIFCSNDINAKLLFRIYLPISLLAFFIEKCYDFMVS